MPGVYRYGQSMYRVRLLTKTTGWFGPGSKFRAALESLARCPSRSRITRLVQRQLSKELRRSEDHSDDVSATKPKTQWVRPSSECDRLVHGGKRWCIVPGFPMQIELDPGEYYFRPRTCPFFLQCVRQNLAHPPAQNNREKVQKDNIYHKS